MLLNRLYNFHWIDGRDAARSSQAYLGRLARFLTANGLKSIVNLRGPHPEFAWWRDETAICAGLGVMHFDPMLDSRRLPLRPMLAGLFDAFDGAATPFVIKCAGGQDRTSLASALYIVHRHGWGAMHRAQRQFARFPFLHFPRRHQRWLRQFLVYAQEQSQGGSLADWVRHRYDPQDFARWLQARGLGDAFKGIFRPRPQRLPT